MNYFGKNLRKLRDDKGLIQEELAEALNIADRSTISRWETGAVEPDLDTLISVADFFEISVDDLVKNEYKTKTVLDNLELIKAVVSSAISQCGDLKIISNMTIEELTRETSQKYIEEGHKFVKDERYQEAAKCFEKAGVLGDSSGYYYAIPVYEKMANYYFKIDEIEESAWCLKKKEICEMRMME